MWILVFSGTERNRPDQKMRIINIDKLNTNYTMIKYHLAEERDYIGGFRGGGGCTPFENNNNTKQRNLLLY